MWVSKESIVDDNPGHVQHQKYHEHHYSLSAQSSLPIIVTTIKMFKLREDSKKIFSFNFLILNVQNYTDFRSSLICLFILV